MKIRKVRINDFESVKDIMLKALETDPTAFSVDYSEYASNSDSWWRLYLNDYLIGIHASLFFSLDEDDQINGIIGLVFNRKARMFHVASIVWFYVFPEKRGLGIGKNLLEYALVYLGELKHIRKVGLTVISSQKNAIKLYEKKGFKTAGIQKDEIKILDSFYDFISMERVLE